MWPRTGGVEVADGGAGVGEVFVHVAVEEDRAEAGADGGDPGGAVFGFESDHGGDAHRGEEGVDLVAAARARRGQDEREAVEVGGARGVGQVDGLGRDQDDFADREPAGGQVVGPGQRRDPEVGVPVPHGVEQVRT
ncbi:hypothetical protein GCM10023205_83310 [Yinghuangia aomiensis]|uniref:Uncharacterized protein n=1 Tax=Yinghuangia aomiensis TaxID=676205 RepID=A0ABP9IHU2_9ACTN